MDTSAESLKYPIGRHERPDTYTKELLEEWIAIIGALPSWMDACIENLDADQLATPYRDGGWTVNQVIHHLADSHMNAYVRLKLALTEDKPIILPYDQDAWAVLADVDKVPVNISVTLLHALHRRMVALMNTLQPADWERTYIHPEYKREFAIWEVAALYAWHSRHHMEHIRRLRERMNW
jgi:hypothetical protein